jgi:hypothetical protein
MELMGAIGQVVERWSWLMDFRGRKLFSPKMSK